MKTKPPVYEVLIIQRVSNGFVLVDHTPDVPVCTVHTDLGELMTRSRLILDRVETGPANEPGEGKLSASEFERLYHEDLGSNVRSISGPRNPRESQADETSPYPGPHREIPTDDHPST